MIDKNRKYTFSEKVEIVNVWVRLLIDILLKHTKKWQTT